MNTLVMLVKIEKKQADVKGEDSGNDNVECQRLL